MRVHIVRGWKPHESHRHIMKNSGIVRAVMLSGKVQGIYRTSVIQNSLQPIWKEARERLHPNSTE